MPSVLLIAFNPFISTEITVNSGTLSVLSFFVGNQKTGLKIIFFYRKK